MVGSHSPRLRPNPQILDEDQVLMRRYKTLDDILGITPGQAELYTWRGLRAELHEGRVYLEWCKSSAGRVTSVQAWKRFQQRLNMTAAQLAADKDYQAMIKRESPSPKKKASRSRKAR